MNFPGLGNFPSFHSPFFQKTSFSFNRFPRGVSPNSIKFPLLSNFPGRRKFYFLRWVTPLLFSPIVSFPLPSLF
ncbi:MAG: hypothetical protein C6I01_01545 [Epsilonproteobacteria bacterium]|nr:hypothetical protein [Campylobacterota bacterium]